MEVRLISSVDTPHDSENWQTQPALESWAKKCFGCAAHQVPHVTQRLCVNFYSSISFTPAKHITNQLGLKTLLKPLQSNMHNMRRRISVFINCCTHMCTLVCISVCVAKGDAWFPIDVIIFHSQAVISARVQRYFYYSVCVTLCVSVHAHEHANGCVLNGGRERDVCVGVLCLSFELHKNVPLSRSSRLFLVHFG